MLSLPVHVGIIMDGNGRWAQKRGKQRAFGHKAGMDRLISLAEHAQNIGIKYLTLYTLSTENLSRPKKELDGLFGLFRRYFKSNVKKIHKSGGAVKVIGDRGSLPEDIIKLIEESEQNTPAETNFTLIFAINYGSRQEIVNAVNRAIERGEKVDGNSFSSLLYTGGIPDPDLIIRTGGEIRLSNFLMYQSAYAELYFSEVLFPDFSEEEFDKAIKDYTERDRRFGKV